jgi:hypothetical protein
VVGFIQRIDDQFETTEIGHPRQRRYFHSFADALASLAASRDER